VINPQQTEGREHAKAFGFRNPQSEIRNPKLFQARRRTMIPLEFENHPLNMAISLVALE
jgi:hypothetical protein